MDFKETMVSTETIFEGKIITVLKDEVTLPNGKLASREVVRHPGGVAILALDDEYNAYLVRQYRYPMEMELLELPAGKLDMDGEDSMNAAARELSEETGLIAGELLYLGYILASPGFCDEALHMYVAQDLTQEECHPDEDEFVEVCKMPFDELVARILAGQITDGKTVATTLKAKVLLGL